MALAEIKVREKDMRRRLLGLIIILLINTSCTMRENSNLTDTSVITLNWYYMIGDFSIKERREEINNYLLKSKSGYQINFINLIDVIPYDTELENLVYTSMSSRILDYMKSAQENKEKIDIISVNQLGSMDFSRTYLVDEGLLTELDTYFLNEDSGKIIYNAYPEIVFDSQKINGKSYFIPGSLFDLVETKRSCFDHVAYMAIKQEFIDQYKFDLPVSCNLLHYEEFLKNIGNEEDNQLLFYNCYRIMNSFPYLTPVCGNSLEVSPFVIDEKTQTIKIIYECEEWMQTLSTYIKLYQNNYYVLDPTFNDMDAVIWYDYVSENQQKERELIADNYEFINVIPYWGLAIPSWCDRKDDVMNFFSLLYKDPELSRVFFPNGAKQNEKIFFGTGNPYIVENTNLPKDLTKENHQKFYESLNKSCAYGFTFDFSEYFDEMQDLVVKHNEYYTFYNDPRFIDMEKYKEVMKDTRIEEIRDDLNAQLQRYLKGD